MSMVYTEFTLTITANDADIRKTKELLEEILEEEFEEGLDAEQGEPEKAVFNVEECVNLPTPNEVEAFAVQLAKLVPESSFHMECCHLDERCGGPFDFSVSYSDGNITSDAYLFNYEPMAGEEFQYNYPDYDYFCEEITDPESGECPYSEAEYEEFCSAEMLYICYDPCSVLTEVPGLKTYPVE